MKSPLLLALLITVALPAQAQTTAAGSTPGSFRVTESGAAEYSIPIRVPPGIAGMEPKLALVYNSQAGNGLLGVGWHLEGLSAITRCPRTMAQDGVRGGINYDSNDRFCLDGQRLIAISGSDGIHGTEYRTERESFTKLISYGAAGAGPAWFKAWTKSGQILEYGNTLDSRIEAQGKPTVRAWAVNKVSDVKGNSFTVTYAEDDTIGDYKPQRIDFTGSAGNSAGGPASIRFVYETRGDIVDGYSGGSRLRVPQRLSGLEIYLGATIVTRYVLNYADATYPAVSHVRSIQECLGDASACRPALTFTWNAQQTGFSSQTSTFWSNWKDGDGPIGFADIDGDGKADFWGWSSSGNIGIRFAQPDGGFGPETSFFWSAAKAENGPVGFADINGDGKADFYAWAADGNIVVRFSNGDGTFSGSHFLYWSTWKQGDGPIGFADIDGDGRADFWGWSSNGNVYVNLSNGDGTFGPRQATYWSTWKDGDAPIGFADINGDGMADLWGWGANGNVYVKLSQGDGTFGSDTGLYWSNWKPGDGPIGFADINGDGAADFWGWRNDGYIVWALSKGDGTFTPFWYSMYWSTWKEGDSPIGFADLNGDGRADFYGWAASGTVYTRLMQPDGNPVSHFDGLYWSNWHPGDAPIGFESRRGDGKLDFYGWSNTGNVAASHALYDSPQRILRFADSLGHAIDVAYKPVTDASVHARQAAAYPQVDLQVPLYVVSSVSRSNAIGGAFDVEYRFGGLKADRQRRDSLGFQWIESTDRSTGLKARTEYRQDWPFVGLSSLVKRTQGSGAVLSETSNTHGCTNPGTSGACAVAPGNRYFPFVSRSVESAADLDGGALPAVTAMTQYDSFGNATSVTVSAGDGYNKTTTNTYSNDAASWSLGRLTRSTVQSTAP